MAYEKLARLVCKIYKRTIEGEINWEETATTGVYQTSFADYSILISLQPSQSGGESDVEISIIDVFGNEVESFLDVDLKSNWLHDLGITKNPYSVMKETYDIARRVALGSEKAVDDILAVLEDDGIPF